ncbi:acyltransferase [Lysobacter arvi]|uniref:Acyltransferase n=1 Tax=Lysobacter arvi TaxID=3038776 RepID=A0ABU1C913_9GAMM|nr:acyltransferase [Lysobacter arvi]MDR0181664.1 acyltransferase [Lysobacter arvi]
MNILKVYVEAGVRIRTSGGGTIRFASNGDRIYVSRGCDLIASGGSISIGHGTFFNKGCTVVSHDRIDIGSDVMFGPNASVFDSDHRCEIGAIPFRRQGFITSPVSIGSNVWIGQGGVVTKGSQIADSTAIAANSVVRGVLPPNGLYGGIPAKRLRELGTS